MARYLADEHEHDLSELATYDDIRTAATDGSLDVEVTEENVYVLSGLADDLADGPDAVDRDQLELAVELLRDVGEYSEDDIVEEALDADQPLGRLIAHVLDPETVRPPSPPYAERRRAVGGAGGLPRVAAAPRVAPQSSIARGCRGSYKPNSPPPGSRMVVSRPQPSSADGGAGHPLHDEVLDRGVDVVAHQIQLVGRRAVDGMYRNLGRGSLKISQPPPASTCG